MTKGIRLFQGFMVSWFQGFSVTALQRYRVTEPVPMHSGVTVFQVFSGAMIQQNYNETTV